MRKVPHVLVICVSLVVGFWFYGSGRTMCETVNFQPRAFFAGMVVGVIFPLAIIVPIYIGKKILFDNNILPISRLLIVFAASLFIGGLVSEVLIMRDEGRFFAEVQKQEVIYHRARVWPNEGCSLVYIPGRGVHSTD